MFKNLQYIKFAQKFSKMFLIKFKKNLRNFEKILLIFKFLCDNIERFE